MLTQIDDADSRIQYSGSWRALVSASAGREFGGTGHKPDAPGATAIVPFNGTSIRVLATIGDTKPGRGPPVTSYRVDDGSPVTFTAPTIPSTIYNQSCFETTSLASDQPHTLTITFNGGGDIYFDYFEVNNTSKAAGRIGSGAIAGIAVSAAAALLIFGFAIVLYLRRRKVGYNTLSWNAPTEDTIATIRPYPLSVIQPYASTSPALAAKDTQTSPSVSAQSSTTFTSTSIALGPPPTRDSKPTVSLSWGTGNASSSGQPRRETDPPPQYGT